jgi:hypothetical protein
MLETKRPKSLYLHIKQHLENELNKRKYPSNWFSIAPY